MCFQVRTEELAALAKAVEIIGGESVSGSAGKHIRQTSFLQVRRVQNKLQKAGEFLQQTSLALSWSKAGGMDKVVNMIKKLISQLEAEHRAEGEHHEWCVKEKKENDADKEKATQQVCSKSVFVFHCLRK